MKKTLLTLVAVAFVAAASGSAFAAKHNTEKLMAACKDKKPGEMVKLDGKNVKCPKPKKEEMKK